LPEQIQNQRFLVAGVLEKRLGNRQPADEKNEQQHYGQCHAA
jgi:hypothetical protein